VKFVHAADLHIDSPLRGLTRYEGAPVERARRATREAFERIVGLCLEEQAHFLVLAGDVFHDEKPRWLREVERRYPARLGTSEGATADVG